MGFKEIMNPIGTAIKRADDELKENGFISSQMFQCALIKVPRIYIDDTHKRIAVFDNIKAPVRFYDYTDIIGYELFEDGNSVLKGSMVGAAIGEAALGTAGGIIGSSMRRKISSTITSMQVIIILKDMQHPNVTINVLTGKTQRGSFTYKNLMQQAKFIMSTFDNIKNQVAEKQAKVSEALPSSADEISKFKSLLDSGAITQDEYEAKKKQLLGI